MQAQRWLFITRSSGEAPIQYSKAQKARLGTATRKKARNATRARAATPTVEHHDALRNKVFADVADKNSWKPFLRPNKSTEVHKLTKPEVQNGDLNNDSTQRRGDTDLCLGQAVEEKDERQYSETAIIEEPKADKGLSTKSGYGLPAKTGYGLRPKMVKVCQPNMVKDNCTRQLGAHAKHVTATSSSSSSSTHALQPYTEGELDEAQCEACQATILATDLSCAACGAARAVLTDAERTMCSADGLRHESADDIEKKNTSEGTAKDNLKDEGGEVEISVEQVRRRADHATEPWSGQAIDLNANGLPLLTSWHGGTLVPPPPQLAASPADAERAATDDNKTGKKKKTSGYALWVKDHKSEIKSNTAPGATSIRAFGAAAGLLWRNVEPQLKAHYNDAARNQTSTASEIASEPVIARAAPTMPPSSPVSAVVGSTHTLGQLGTTAPKCRTRSLPPTLSTRVSPLDMSDDEAVPEPGEEDVQPTPPQAAPPYREEPPPRFSRLEALKARVLNRIRAQSASGDG